MMYMTLKDCICGRRTKEQVEILMRWYLEGKLVFGNPPKQEHP
jgi:hypothetical protein